MLWFSIPAVILLASIPVLVIISQIEDFRMPKITFAVKMAVACYVVGAFAAFYKHADIGVIFLGLCALWVWEDIQ